MLLKGVIFLFSLGVAISRQVPFFRRDYTYVEQFDAFYKLHWDPAGQSWNSAFLACDGEGSTLFYPKTTDEWMVVKGLAASLKLNITEVLVGLHDEAGMGEFVTVEGLPTPYPILDHMEPVPTDVACVSMDIQSGKFTLGVCQTDIIKPFVCKRVELPSCPTIDHDYVIHKEINKCYKVHGKPKVWYDAMHTCFMEGGHLAVITNQIEAIIVKSQLLEGTDDYFVGYHRLPSGDFYTVKGQDFNTVFYQVWWNSKDENTKKDCGIVRKSGGYRDLYTLTEECEKPTPFVCEMLAV